MRISTLICCTAMVGSFAGCENVENAKSKEEYSILQVVEYEHRDMPISTVEIVERSGYSLAGFQAENKNKNVWVLLNPRYPPYFKQVPDSTFNVSRQALEIIRRTPDVSKDVLAALEARVPNSSS